MKCTLSYSALLHGLRTVSGAIGTSRYEELLLSYVLLHAKAEQQQITLVTTDLEIAECITIPAAVEQEGSIAVPFERLLSFVEMLPVERKARSHLVLTLSREEPFTRLRVQSERGWAIIDGHREAEYPGTLANVAHDECVIFRADASHLAHLKTTVAFAAGNDTIFPAALAGVFCTVDTAGKLTLVAHDKKHLAIGEVALKEPPSSAIPPIVIPASTLGELSRLLHYTPMEYVQVALHEPRLHIAFLSPGGDVMLLSRLIAQSYPSFVNPMQAEYASRAVVSTLAFAEALKEIAPICKDNPHGICSVSVQPGREESAAIIRVEARAEPHRSQYCEIAGVIQHGVPFDLALTHEHVSAVVQSIHSIKSDTIALEVGELPSASVVVRPVEQSSEDARFAYLLATWRV